MKFVRSLLFDFLFYLSTSFIVLFFSPFLLLPVKKRFIVPQLWAKWTLLLAKHILGLHCKVVGTENLPKGPFIVASKHQSAWETIILNMITPYSVFILKRELLRIPILNFYLIGLKAIAVKRGGGSKTVEDMLQQAKKVISQDLSIIIFPEGTRGFVGQKTTYRQGVGNLYQELDVPVVPIALNSGLFWGRRSFLKTSGEVLVEILPPIYPGLEKEEFMKTLKATIETASDRLCFLSEKGKINVLESDDSRCLKKHSS